MSVAISLGGARVDGDYTVEWWTPSHVFNALGLTFDLDPCAPPLPGAEWIPARERYALPADGLALPWSGRVWLNPPYGREAARWVARLAEHGDGVALVFARTCAVWAQKAMRDADAVCFIAGRLRFIDGRTGRAPDNAAAPSMLLGFGATCAEAVLGCGLGIAHRPRSPLKESGDGET